MSKPTFRVTPGLNGRPAACLFYVKKEGDSLIPSIRFSHADTGREAQFIAEGLRDEIMKDPDIITCAIMWVVNEARPRHAVKMDNHEQS